jgi:FkbM family methyltransferase
MSRWPRATISDARRRGKVSIGRALSNPAHGILISCACRDQIRSKGVIIDTSPPEFTPVVKAQPAFGIYESAEIRFIRKYLRGYRQVLELGSSLGVTAAHILDVAGPGAEVVRVEANPHLLGTLRATTATTAERTGAHVKTIHGAVPPDLAIGSQSVVLMLGRSHLGSQAGSARSGDPGRQLRVPAVDLAEVIRGWTDYAVVCDIEGAEATLILSAQPVLTGASRLVIELHETTYAEKPVTVADLKDALLNIGFTLVAENGRVMVLNGPRTKRQMGDDYGRSGGDRTTYGR